MFKICLIVGGGSLPHEIIKHFKKEEIFIIALKEAGIDFSKFYGFCLEVISYAKVGKMIRAIKSREISTVCFAGNIKKPSFSSLIPDFKGLFLLFKILKLKLRGDDAILKTIIDFMSQNKLEVKGVGEICQSLITKKGILTKTKPSKKALLDFELGEKILKGISQFDIGQAIALQDGIVLGVEAIEGTDILIKRCADLSYKGNNPPVLVKMAKVDQTLKIDMPAIGIKTIEELYNSGFAGIFIKSGSSLFLQQEEAISLANEKGIFIVGF